MSRIVGEHEDSEEREGSSRSTQSRSAQAHADAEKDSDSPFSSNNRLNSVYAQLKHVAAAQIRQNLSLDPTERRNLARDSAESETLGRLRASARGAALPAATRQMGGQ